MAVTKRTVQLQGLSDITTYITDTENRYFNITDIPEELSTGRSSFKLLGSPFLRENVVLKMELVDFKGRPIYMEPVFNYVEGQGIRVSIEVYDDVPEGTAELTILGEIDPTKVDFEIPPQFVDVYNVKYTKIISINKEIINSRPIRFFKRPKAVISEIIKGQVTSTASTTGSNNQSLGTVLGVPAVGTEGNTFVTDSAAYNEIPSYTDEQFGFSPFGNYDVQKITSPKYTFTVDGADFSSSMVGGTISITNPQANLGFNPSGEFSTPKYSARISRVINKKTIEVQKPFGIYDSGSNAFKISALNSSTYNVNWPKPTEFDSSSINFRSFADVQLYDVRTFSGDVYRIAGYVKNNGPFSNWQKVIDTPIESPELLIDPTSITGTTRLGYYSGDDIFTKYWNAFSGDFNSGPTGAGAITLQTYSADQYLNDSLFISGSVSIDLLDGNEDTGIVLQLKPQYSMSFVEGVAYSISGRAVVNNIGGSSNTAKAVFHLSGSAFGDSNKYDGFGRAIAAVTVENAANKLSRVENPYFEKVFVADSTGTAMLHVRFDSGIWELSELSIRPAADTNFSPEFIRLNSVLPPLQKRPDNLDFAFEFYNANNEKSTTVITTLPDFPDGVQFEGENINILGNDNVVGGSLFLGGDTTSSGIHFGGIESKLPETGNDGATASGFIRSVQYQGFTSASANNSHTGFMIYSGSVLPNSGDNYSGVGLELVGASGSLRFGTVPSRFEVIADSFFVGNSGSQFISGSGGIIEISSSAFHLSASGDVIISGSVTATEGNIGNWKIVDGKLSGSNATLDADGSALFMSTKGPDTNPNDGFYIDFTPTGHYVRFGTNFAVSSSGQLIASGAVIEGVLTASEGFIADWTIGSNTIHKPTGGTFTGLSSTGDTRFFAAATSLQNSGSAPFNVKTTGDITGSKVLFTGGKIGGFELTDQVLRNSNNTVELSSTLPGLAIKDPGGANRVLVKSGSLSTVGGATNRVGNNSFELDSISAGRNFVSSITSWSFTEHGATNISLTDRSNYSNANKAVTGDVTLDVVVPAGSGNYSTANNYKLIHVVTGSFVAGDTLSFSSVARFSSSFGGVGKDRALAPQYFRVEYSGSGTSGQFVPFLPEAQFTASNGYGEYFLGSGQYSSFGASGDLPGAADYVRVVLSGSINDDTGFTVEKPLFAGAKGDVAEELKVKKLAVEVKGSTTAEYPETELTFDNFSLKSNTRRVEVTQDGLLIYNSEDSFIKMTGAGIEIRGGSGVANFGTSVNRESFTNDSQVAGTLGAPALQPYTSNPNDISTTASPGNVGEFARGNHQHRLEFSTVNTLIGQNTVTGLSAISASITALTSSAISASGTGSFGAILVNGNPVVGATVGGSDTQVQFNDGGSFGAVAGLTFNKTTSKLSATGGVSGSATSTGSFGRIDASNLTGTNTGDVTLAGSRDYITISNQVITRNQIDIGDDTNLAVGTGLNLTGDTVSVDFTDSDLRSHISGSYKGDGVFSGSVQITHDDTTGFVANEHIDHSSVSITAGSGLTGGGSITTTRALNVGQGTGITVNATNITTNDSQIVHDNLSGFVANEHIDHSGVTLSAGTGLTGGGDITTNRSFSIDFTDSDLKSHVSGSYKGDGVFSGSVQITHDDTTGFVANEHIDHTGVTITAGAGLTGGGTIASSRTINAVAGTGISVNADNITTNDSEIVHDNLSGFVANEHIDHSGVSVVAGAGLTGGGTIVSNRTINVVGGTGITANADDIATNDSEIVHDNLSGFVANEHIDHSGVSVTAGAGLTGGGTIAATRTINVVGGTGITANANDIATNDSEIVHDNLSGFVANEHIDHTSVSITAGTGLSGGGDISGTRTLAVDFTDSTFKANVTGSSTALSASLSGRITTEASNVDSLQAASASFSTRVTSNKTKLDTIETNADVTDTANVTSAGALMDSELTSISDVKALNQSVISGASPTFGTANFTDASDKRLMTDAQETKLDSVESSADVTDTANVTSAGALMDSELTSISDVKALDQSVISGASPTFGTANLTDATNKRLMTDAQETKLDSVESSADVTDTANVTSAGALMDSEVTNLSLVKGLTSGISNGNVLVANSVVADNDFLKIDGTSVEGRTAAEVRSDLGVESGATADQTDAEIRAAVEAATDSNVFTDADHTKLNAIEASADVTDTANVTAAGALMDSEVDADIKTLVLPASTTISAFGRTLIDDAAASNARTTLGLGSISTLSSIDISANTNLAASTGITLTGDTLTTNDGEIVHDDLSGFVANEHIDHTSVTLTAGAGLTGGGTIAANRTFAVGQGTGVTVNANDIAIGQEVGTGNSPTFAGGTLGNIKVGVTGDNELDTSSGNLTIDSAGGTITLDDNVIISGNLTVSGTETIIDSTTLNVADRIIELNAGTNDGGLFVKETSGGNATGSLLYDVSENRWVAGTVGSTTNIVGTSTTDTLTNKTINASNNTLSNIANSSLSNSTVNFGGITVALGASDTTPAFDLQDATGLPIVAGTTGTLSVARGGTGATSLNNLITLSSHTTGNYVASLVAGTGIDLSNNSGEGATPTVAVDVSDFMSNGLDNRILTAAGADTMNAEENLTFDGSTLAIADGRSFSTSTFISGILGDGFRIDDSNNNSGSSLEIDNIVVRNTLRTHIFQKDVVKATNGILLVSDSGVISGSTGTTSTGTVTVENDKSATFTSGQKALFKEAGDDGSINFVQFTFTNNGTTVGVQSGFTKYNVTANNGTLANLEPGGTFARISGGSVLIDASSANSPFIDINYASGSTTARFGNLAGITSPRFGALGSNFGFWASGSAFLEGSINALSGNIGGWGIGSTAISSSGGNVTIDAATKRITINDGSNDRVYLGEIAGSSTYGLRIFDGTGTNASDIIVDLGPATNKIAGWEIIPGRFQFDDANGSIALDATNKQLAIYTGSINTAKPKVVVGNLPTTGTAKYGFGVFAGTGNADISDDTTYSVLITKDEARLAGWDLVPGRLKSGTVADINGNQASIALGTGATSATGTPTDGLFFVSASTSPVFYVGSTFSYVDDVLTAGGWKIGKGQISSSNGQAILSGSGVLSLGSGTHNYAQANRTYIDGPLNRMSIGQNFTYTSNVLTAGGWTIGNGQINDTNSRAIINATSAYISIGTGTNAYNSANRIYLDGPNAKISIGTGFRYISDALTIDGNATIAGWAIGSGAISKNDVKLDSTTNAEGLYVKKTSFSSNTAGGFLGLDSGTAKFNVGDASKFIKFDGTNFTVDAGNFSLDSSGNMTATSATLTGTVTATAGQIGGFGIAAGAISSSNNNLALSATHASMSLGNKIKVVGGTDSFIAGGEFFSGVSGDSVAGFDNDFEGFILGMDGNDSIFEISDGTVGENFIRFSTAGDGLLQLASSNIHLQSSGFSLSARSSTATTNKLSLGSITSTTDSSGKGFFADGGGNFRVIGDGSTTVEISGSGIDIKTNSFYFGDNSQFISGSGGVLQISSSAFHLNGGDVVMSGSVTAGSGDIGGWTIGASTLTGGNVTLDSGGSIKVGTLVDANRTDLTTKGFFADNDGNVLIKADDANNNFIKFDADATNPIEMKTTNFHLDTSGDITMTGDITATNITATTAGNLGGWSLDSAGLSKKQEGKSFSKYTSSFVNDNQEPRIQLDRIFKLPFPFMSDGGGERTQMLFKNADDAGAMTMSFKGALPGVSVATTPSSYINNSDIGKRGSIEMYVGSSQRSSSAAYNSGNGRDPGGGVNAFKSFFGGASLGVRVNYRDKLGPTDYDVNDYMGMTATVADMTTNHGSLKGRGAFFYASKYSGSWMYMGSGSVPTEMADFRIPHDRHPGGLSGDRNYGIALWSGSYFHMTGSAGNPPTASIHGHLTLAGGDYAYGRRGNFNSSLAQATDGVQFGSGSTLNIVAQNSNGMHEPYMTFIKPGTSGIGLHTLAHVTGSNTKLVMRTMNFAHPYRDLMTWDASTARVGILDTSPSYTLDVGGTINASEIRINGSIISTGGLGNVSEDTSPQLGGDLDLNGDDITGTGNINITGTGTFSSTLVANGDFTVDTDLLFADVSADKVSITGTGNKVTNKTLHININNASAEPHTGNNISGGGAGDGVLIENHNTTNNSYANLDFRADAADGRIALQRKGTNIGDFVFINDNSGIHETLRITAAGDLHLNENVLFDSSARVIAGKTRMFVTFGRNSTISTTGTTTFEGFGTNGTANGEGYRMVRAGEITGVSTHYDIISAGGSGSTCKVQVTKNAIDVTNANVTHTFVAGGDGTHTTFAAGTHTFSAGDRIGADLILSAVSSTVSLDDCTIVVEITC